ncbi:MAG: LUD domain-containing protein [Candidatus Micrarchaeota archaeon]
MNEFESELSREISRRKGSKKALFKVVDEYYEKRAETGLDEEAMKRELRDMKEEVAKNLDSLIKKATKSFKKHGFKVVLAKDAAEARKAIAEAIGKDRLIVKSKSNTCREIRLEELKNGGLEIIETDTGDYIADLVSDPGNHQVIPALHISPEEISKAVSKALNKKIPADPEKLTHEIAIHLREKIMGAEVGITGANAITASGEIVLIENEGNISLVSRVPKKHIIVAGLEKIVPTLDDAMKVVRSATLWGSGRETPVYLSIIAGPSSTGDIENELVKGAQGAYEVTLILVDNGRSELAKEAPEMLFCVECGACNNLCPAYRQVLGFFGDRYPGPKGIVYSSLEGKGKANYLCNLCSNCKFSCPAGIDLPEYIRKARGKLKMESDKEMIKKIREFGNPFGKVEKGKIPDKLYCC